MKLTIDSKPSESIPATISDHINAKIIRLLKLELLKLGSENITGIQNLNTCKKELEAENNVSDGLRRDFLAERKYAIQAGRLVLAYDLRIRHLERLLDLEHCQVKVEDDEDYSHNYPILQHDPSPNELENRLRTLRSFRE